MPAFSLSRAGAVRVMSNGVLWRANHAALEAACEHFGITKPVRVIASPFRRGKWGGLHTNFRDHHEIRVHTHATAEQASRILWHELCHAGQAARGIKGGTSQVRREQGFDAYYADPREVEARAAEAKHDTLYALTFG